MKSFKRIAALFVACLLITGTSAFAEEFKKEFYQAWPANKVTDLEIDNKFGEVQVKNRADSVSIAVKISVDGTNEKRLTELLDQIEVVFKESGSLVKAQTVIEGRLKGQNNLSIDYEVNLPAEKNLKVNNRYGNTVITSLSGNGEFTNKYGNFTAYELATPEDGTLILNLAYGNASIGSATFLRLNTSYSPVTIEEVNKIKVDSKYSTVNIDEVEDIKIASKYDKYNCAEVGSFSATTKYTNIRIEELDRSLKIEAGYGSISVNQVASDFQSINISNSYGQISLGLDDADYTLDASCTYCGISYPEDEFTGNRIKENNSRTIQGTIGSGDGGKVVVKSRYGEIRLKD